MTVVCKYLPYGVVFEYAEGIQTYCTFFAVYVGQMLQIGANSCRQFVQLLAWIERWGGKK